MRSKPSIQFRRHQRVVARDKASRVRSASRARRHLGAATNLNGNGAAELAVLVDRWDDAA